MARRLDSGLYAWRGSGAYLLVGCVQGLAGIVEADLAIHSQPTYFMCASRRRPSGAVRAPHRESVPGSTSSTMVVLPPLQHPAAAAEAEAYAAKRMDHAARRAAQRRRAARLQADRITRELAIGLPFARKKMEHWMAENSQATIDKDIWAP